MSDHITERINDDLNGLNQEAKKFIDKIEHIRTEEKKIDDIRDKDRHYDGEENNLRRMSR